MPGSKNVCRRATKGRDHSGSDGKKVVKPSQRKAIAQHAVANRNVTIRMACAAFCISETCYRYQPVNDDENARIADLLVDLTEKETDWGFSPEVSPQIG